MKDGDLITFSGRSLLGGLVKWATRSELSHAGLAVWVESAGRITACCLESVQGEGVRIYPLSYYLKQCKRDGVPAYVQSVQKVSGEILTSHAMTRWGCGYPPTKHLVLCGIPAVRCLYASVFGAVKSRPGQPHCSELIADALLASGYPLEVDAVHTSPAYLSSLDAWSEERTRLE